MPDAFIPSREAQLLAFANNFNEHIVASPTVYGLTAAQAAGYTVTFEAFQSAYGVVQNPETRTKSKVAAKNNAKKDLIAATRELARIVQATPGLTDEQKIDLGLKPRDIEPTPVPPPQWPPVLTVAATMGQRVTLRLRDLKNQDKRAKPVGVSGAAVFSYVGETAPVDINEWKFERNTSLTTLQVEFPPTIAAGTKVWFTAFWFNPRKQSGPAAAPVGTTISGPPQTSKRPNVQMKTAVSDQEWSLIDSRKKEFTTENAESAEKERRLSESFLRMLRNLSGSSREVHHDTTGTSS
jgi:hypothetical protein